MHKKLKYLSLIAILFCAGCLVYQGINKPNPSDKNQQFVVIGCSAAGFYAAKDLAKSGAKVICISEENSKPYKKTSFHSYIAKKGQNSSRIDLIKGTTKGIEFLLGAKVVAINSDEKKIIFADSKTLSYDKLLIATGARPQVPPSITQALPTLRIRFYNTREDLNAILSAVDENPRLTIAIIGAGIRSLELADGLKRRHTTLNINILNRSAQFLGVHSDATADEFIAKRIREAGVNFIAPASITSIEEKEKKFTLSYEKGHVEADLIVFAIGTVPNSEIAKSAGLELNQDGSIKVTDAMRTSNPAIYAAGDVAGLKNPQSNDGVRTPKWRTAKEQGQIAAANMLGKNLRYRYEIPAFISSFFGMKTVMSGDVRAKPMNGSAIKAEKNRYSRYVLEEQRLKAFISIWDKGQKRPNIFLLRRKLLDQSPVDPAELLR